MRSTNAAYNEHPADRAHPRSAPACRRGVLLINLGTPDGSDTASVRRYLAEFLADPQVVHLPDGLSWLNKPLARMIALFRGSTSARMYQRIWTDAGSPLMTITRDQAHALAAVMPSGWRVFYAMRYGQPNILDTLREIEAAGIEELVVVPMYPQFSGTTSGTTIREVYTALNAIGHRVSVTARAIWYDDAGYIYSQARLIEDYARTHRLSPDDTFLVFSAHGLPVSYVKRGDPYQIHLRRTVKLVGERLGWPADRLALTYQSSLGPVEWLTPGTDSFLRELAQTGRKRVVVCPISFTADCLETLEEIGMGYRQEFEIAGGELFLCPALNDFDPFIAALKDLVLHGSRPVTSWSQKEKPLLECHNDDAHPQRDLDSLVMIGMSLPGRVRSQGAPELAFADGPTLREHKKSQCQVPDLLRSVCKDGGFREAFVWNTCCRFEMYAWFSPNADSAQRESALARARDSLFGSDHPLPQSVNVLHAADAWRHVMRTVCGLNSGLPGDRDIVEQLQTAHRVADHAGTTGPLTRSLVEDAVSLERELRSETEWGDYATGYCSAALSRVAESTGVNLQQCRVVVIGGSTTSRSILDALTGRFDVPDRGLTLVYRNRSGGHMKLLRKAIGNGRRLRVQSYGQDSVVRAVAEADLVCFGIDTEQPVLDLESIRGIRDFNERPLAVIDFNTFGSVRNAQAMEGVRVWSVARLDEQVNRFADQICSTEQFARAVRSAEAWIAEKTLGLQSRSERVTHRRQVAPPAAPDETPGPADQSAAADLYDRDLRISEDEQSDLVTSPLS